MSKRSRQAANEGATADAPFNLHLSALAEIVIFLAGALAIGVVFDVPDRLSGIVPHPFWIIVILAAARYGTAAGLAAAALATAALLVGNMPEQAFDENLADWLLRTTKLPVIWFLTAIVLGEIRSDHVRTHAELAAQFRGLRVRADRLAGAYEELAQAKARLEQRIAGQKQTLRAAYEASRSIEQQSVAAVLDGALPFVEAIIGPRKASVFVLADGQLKVVAHDRANGTNNFARSFDAASPLFAAIVTRRQHLSVAVPGEEAILGGEGLLAGPLVDGDSGRVFGMLKIEDTDLAGLGAPGAIELRVLCDWIGRACGNACRVAEQATQVAPTPRIGTRQDGVAVGASIFKPVRKNNWQQVFQGAEAPPSLADALARRRAKRREVRIASAEREHELAGTVVNAARRLREDTAEGDRVVN